MSQEYENQLEAAVNEELKALRDLPAPRTLGPRVVAAIAARSAVPWYRQCWEMWPIALRAASLAFLLTLFGGLCFAGWKVPQAQGVIAAQQTVGGWLSGANAIWNALNAILGVFVLALKQLGPWFLWACFAALVAGYAMCVGLSTLCVRLALARR